MDATKELELLDIEEKKLRVEKLREDVAKQKAAKAEAQRREKQAQDEIKAADAAEKYKQSICTHRKGGKDITGLTYGNDKNYAIIAHQYADGKFVFMCSRCRKEWRVGDAQYAEVSNWPTDNEPSGGVTFSFPKSA